MDVEEPSQEYIEAIEEHRLYLRDVDYQNQRDRDRTILGLAGGSLILSVTFLSRVAQGNGWTWILGLAWFVLVVSMAAVVLSYPSARRELAANLPIINKWLESPTSEGPQTLPSDTSARLNLAAPIALVFGLLLLALFAYLSVK